ncbi:MAG: terminase large subunit, partial [Gemmatimonadaceae bacterium]|nr:terminase large subunit [Gemmatimonadaceae bacterium]
AASDRDQAKIIWRMAAQMVLRNPELSTILDVLESSKRIVFKDPLAYGPGFYEAIPADEKGALGFNASGIIVDELLTQPNRKLVDALTTSVGARTQPLTIYFTTAGYDEETICGEEWDRARQIIDGKIIDPYHYCVIFAADEKDDPFSEATWKKANPGWDYMGPQFRAFLKAEARKASTVPAFLNPFKMYHLNVWTKQSVRWMPMDDWDECGQLMPDDLKDRECWMGVSIWDAAKMAAAVLVFAPKGGDEDDAGTYDVIPMYWMPRYSVDRDEKMRDTYLSWEAESCLRIHDGSALDIGQLRADVLAVLSKYDVKGMMGDRSAMFYLEQEVAEAGVPVDRMNHTTTDMSAPTKDVLRLVMSHRLRHAGNPILRWNADNLTVLSDTSGEIRPSRTKSVKSIEGICALVMGVGQAVTNRKPQETDYGVVFIA